MPSSLTCGGSACRRTGDRRRVVPVLLGPFHLELLRGTCWSRQEPGPPAGQLTPLLLAQGPEPSQPAIHLMADPKPGAGMGESMALQRGPASLRMQPWGKEQRSCQDEVGCRPCCVRVCVSSQDKHRHRNETDVRKLGEVAEGEAWKGSLSSSSPCTGAHAPPPPCDSWAPSPE